MLMEYVPSSQSHLEDPSIITATSSARKQEKKIAGKLRHLSRVTEQVAVHKADSGTLTPESTLSRPTLFLFSMG